MLADGPLGFQVLEVSVGHELIEDGLLAFAWFFGGLSAF